MLHPLQAVWSLLGTWFILVECPYCTCGSKPSKGNLCFRTLLPESQVPLRSATLSICLMQIQATVHSSFLTAIIYVKSNIWKYQFFPCSCCLYVTPPAAPSTSLLTACMVSAALCCRQGVSPVASAGTSAGQPEWTDTCSPKFLCLLWLFCPALIDVEGTGIASPLGWPVVSMKFPTTVEHHQESPWWATARTLPSWHKILQAVICSSSPMEPYKLQSLICS